MDLVFREVSHYSCSVAVAAREHWGNFRTHLVKMDWKKVDGISAKSSVKVKILALYLQPASCNLLKQRVTPSGSRRNRIEPVRRIYIVSLMAFRISLQVIHRVGDD